MLHVLAGLTKHSNGQQSSHCRRCTICHGAEAAVDLIRAVACKPAMINRCLAASFAKPRWLKPGLTYAQTVKGLLAFLGAAGDVPGGLPCPLCLFPVPPVITEQC